MAYKVQQGHFEPEMVEAKVILNDAGEIIDKNSMDSDDEQHVVGHLSPQTLLETQESEVQYGLRSPEGTITYRVLQVDDRVESIPQMVTSNQTYSLAAPQPVLASNVNGQFYLIGNATEVYPAQGGTRAIAPRSSLIENNNTVVTNVKKRDERRRATHNEVERRRRDKINNWITKLSKIIPESSMADLKGHGNFDGQSKGGILAKACDYITDTKDIQQKYEALKKDNKVYLQTIEMMKRKNNELEQENELMRELLNRHGIELPKNHDS